MRKITRHDGRPQHGHAAIDPEAWDSTLMAPSTKTTRSTRSPASENARSSLDPTIRSAPKGKRRPQNLGMHRK